MGGPVREGAPVQAPAPPDPTARVPASLRQVAARVDARVQALLDGELERWHAVDPDLDEPLAALRDLVLAGGKRLRPAFCHWAYVGAGGDPADQVVADAGAALELLHTFALVHDDVMDGSSHRRGLETVHTDFAHRHQSRGWRGDGRRFGDGVAILVGDLAFVYADLLLDGAPPPAVEVFAELRIEVNIGQYLDLLHTVRGGTRVEQSRRICRYKSGKYTVERPLHLGAALAQRLDEMSGALSAYGLPLGEAFQLRDDLLGAFGEAAVTGKPVGEDLREGKPTVLLAIARERATGANMAVLERVGEPGLDEDEVAEIQRVLVDTGARDEVNRAIDHLVAEAVESLVTAPLAPEARDALADLATFVAGRDH